MCHGFAPADISNARTVTGNLHSLMTFAQGPSHVSGTIPQGIFDGPLREFYSMATMQSGHLPGPAPRHYLLLMGTSFLSGTMPGFRPGHVKGAITFNVPRISGTTPNICGQQRLNIVIYRGLGISGTLPDGPSPNHPSAQYREDGKPVCVRPQTAGIFVYETGNGGLSGTLPPAHFCSNGSASVNSMYYMISDSKISGTVPACMAKGAFRYSIFNLATNRFEGRIPLFNQSSLMQKLHMEQNYFTAFPSALPPSLKLFAAGDNPQIAGTGKKLAKLLSTAPELVDVLVSVDNTLRYAHLISDL